MAKPSPAPGTLSNEPSDRDSNDFADEAGYSRPETLRPKVARDPPKISEDHMWGVREDWGKKAGEWGQGVKGKRSSKGEDEEE
jgi:protein AFG1